MRYLKQEKNNKGKICPLGLPVTSWNIVSTPDEKSRNKQLILYGKKNKALMIWGRKKIPSGLFGIVCLRFENISSETTAALIDESIKIVQRLWPGEWLYVSFSNKTVPLKLVESFKLAGWRECFTSRKSRIFGLSFSHKVFYSSFDS